MTQAPDREDMAQYGDTSHKQRANARRSDILHDGDPETSYEAADSITPEAITQQQQRILDVLHDITLGTDEQIYRAYKKQYGKETPTEQSIRSRRAQLVKQQKVRWTGEHGTSGTGRRSRLWEAAS